MNTIVLIGFMGSGKTTIGKKLADKYNLKFVDMDEEIEKSEKMSINDIFKINGEAYFRNRETNVLKMIINKPNLVISTGGGIIEREENIEILKTEKNVIWLNVNENTILNNIGKELEKRPKLNGEKDVNLKIKELLRDRYDKYKKASNVEIDANNKNIDEVVSDILVYINKNMLL